MDRSIPNQAKLVQQVAKNVRRRARLGLRRSAVSWGGGLEGMKNRLIGGLLARKLEPEATGELSRRETTVLETAASAIPPLPQK